MGEAGPAFGADFALRAALVHPFTVCLTLYVAALVTVMEGVVAPLLHINVPVYPLAVNTELPQLLTTVMIGAAGVAFGADVALRVALVHPFTVCLTVYVAVLVTVIEGVVAPLLHNNVPVYPLAVNTELPQLLTTVMIGAAGVAFGTDVALLVALVHPFTVCLTVYVAALDTIIDAVFAPLLHNKVPVYPLAVNTELPQLFTTVTLGAGGVAFGAAVALRGALAHPFKV